MIYHSEAAEALAAIDDTRARLAAASDTPPLRHAAFAAMMGGFVAVPALPLVWRSVATVMLAVAIVLVIGWDRRRTGMFINGYRAGRTRVVTATLLVCIMPLYALSAWLAIHRGAHWQPLVLGAVAAGIAYADSVWWCRVFRREMTSRAA